MNKVVVPIITITQIATWISGRTDFTDRMLDRLGGGSHFGACSLRAFLVGLEASGNSLPEVSF